MCPLSGQIDSECGVLELLKDLVLHFSLTDGEWAARTGGHSRAMITSIA